MTASVVLMVRDLAINQVNPTFSCLLTNLGSNMTYSFILDERFDSPYYSSFTFSFSGYDTGTYLYKIYELYSGGNIVDQGQINYNPGTAWTDQGPKGFNPNKIIKGYNKYE